MAHKKLGALSRQEQTRGNSKKTLPRFSPFMIYDIIANIKEQQGRKGRVIDLYLNQ